MIKDSGDMNSIAWGKKRPVLRCSFYDLLIDNLAQN